MYKVIRAFIDSTDDNISKGLPFFFSGHSQKNS